jgi:uncharacterized protein (DUF2141 family)
MRFGSIRVFMSVLLAAALLLAMSCTPAAPGGIDVTVTASGVADGKTGNLQIEVYEGSVSAGNLTRFHVNNGYKLLSGTPYEWSFEDLAPGSHVVRAYLDMDDDEVQSAGDYIASAGATTVTVISDISVPAVVEINLQ